MSRLKWEFWILTLCCMASGVHGGWKCRGKKQAEKGAGEKQVIDGEKERSRASEENHGCLEMRLFYQK